MSYAVTFADAMVRVCNLVEEVRWRFDLDSIRFVEQLGFHDRAGFWIQQIVAVGRDSESFLLYATCDLWADGMLVRAQVDAGGMVVEASDPQTLIAKARSRRLAAPHAMLWDVEPLVHQLV